MSPADRRCIDVRAAVYQGPKQIRVQDLVLPKLGPLDVLLDVEACGVCGSDIGSYKLGHYVVPGQVMGHEISARVAALGSKLHGLEVGKQVAIRPMLTCGRCAYCRSGRSNLCGETAGRSLGYGLQGGYAEQILFANVVVGADVIPIAQEIPIADLLWCEPLAVAVHALSLINIRNTDSLLVLGAGSVGLCIVAAALAAGMTDIVVVEPRLKRREAAALLGAQALDPGEIDSGRRFGAALDTSGVSRVISDAATHLHYGAPLVLVGLGDGPIPWPIRTTQLMGSFAYTDRDFQDAVEQIVSGRVRLGRFITHTFPLDATADAILASATDPSLVKAAVIPLQQKGTV
jgi:2-desacetyl-2-hydroxyethyl bacteriochlorophyllide A dehydrogenase